MPVEAQREEVVARRVERDHASTSPAELTEQAVDLGGAGQDAEPPPLAKMRRIPGTPTQGERDQHQVSHIPFRSWCGACIRGRGRMDQHRHLSHEDDQEIVQIDYMYPLGLEGRRAISAVDAKRGYGISSMVQLKGSSDAFAVRLVVEFLSEVGHDPVILQCDPEASITDFCRSVAAKHRGKVLLRVTPRASSVSNGAVERFHQSVQGVTATLTAAVEQAYGVMIDKDHLLIPWAIRHASWLYTRFQRHADGETSFKAFMQRDYKGEVYVFVEQVWAPKELSLIHI